MLKNIGAGWCELTITESKNGKEHTFHAVPSYITDVPEDTLLAFLHYFKYGAGTAYYDEEDGFGISLVLNHDGLFVFSTSEQETLDIFCVELRQLAEELCKDIETDIDGWATFNVYDPVASVDEVSCNREKLFQMVAELRQLVNVR